MHLVAHELQERKLKELTGRQNATFRLILNSAHIPLTMISMKVKLRGLEKKKLT